MDRIGETNLLTSIKTEPVDCDISELPKAPVKPESPHSSSTVIKTEQNILKFDELPQKKPCIELSGAIQEHTKPEPSSSVVYPQTAAFSSCHRRFRPNRFNFQAFKRPPLHRSSRSAFGYHHMFFGCQPNGQYSFATEPLTPFRLQHNFQRNFQYNPSTEQASQRLPFGIPPDNNHLEPVRLRGSGRRHPPSLKGKEIGLWYASRAKKRKREISTKEFKLDQKNIDKIVQIVKDVERLGSQPLNSNAPTGSGHAQLTPSASTSNQDVVTHSDGPDSDIIDLTGEEDDHGDIVMVDLTAEEEPIPADPLVPDPALNEELKSDLLEQMRSPQYLAMSVKRAKLPTFAKKQELVETINSNQVVVVSGETGCGKTTQIPQYLLEDAILRGEGSSTRIVVTQPRRISAITVAERVASERGQELGEDVGYQIRLETVPPRRRQGSLLFCTTGIVLQWFHSDPLLKGVSHIIVDEVHEREMLGDFLITMLKRIAPQRPDLRIVLMSATLNAEFFSSFFGGCPTFSIPGRLFPVKPLYLEDVLHLTKFQMDPADLDRFSKMTKRTLSKRSISVVDPNINSSLRERYKHWLRRSQSSLSLGSKQFMEALDILGCPPPELVATAIDHIIQTTESGAILAFVPGLADIIETTKALRRINPHLYAETSNRVKIYPLHSRLPSARQRCVFDPPPRGQRKIVVATNIAETSITIEDVVFVVDCGHIKLTTYDPQTNTSTLAPVLVSKANAAQRRGRAGRVRPGMCYHLFSSFVRDEVMLENLPPEITRIRLDDVILRIKVLDLGPVTQFLQSCLDPPAPEAINRTLKFLRDIQALEPVIKVEDADLASSSSVPVMQTSKMSKKQRQRLMNNAIQQGISSATASPLPVADNDRLTSLGYHLANLPLEPQCAKLLILGALFCCLEPILAVAACLAFKDPFEVPLDKQAIGDRRRQELAGDSLSDHWVYHVVLSEYRTLRSYSERSQFCWKNFLNQRTMEDLRHLMQDFAGLLYERRYIGSARFDDAAANRNSYNLSVFRAVLAGALYPNFVMLTERPQKNPGSVPPPHIEGRPSEGAVSIHPKSVNGFIRPIGQAWLTYFTRLKLDHGAKSTIFDTTAIGSRPIVFFSGKVSNLKVGDEEVLILDDWIRFKSSHRLAELMKSLKKCIDKLLDCKIRRPGPTDWDQQTIEGRLLQIIVDLFTSEPPVLTHIKTERPNESEAASSDSSFNQHFRQSGRFQPRGGFGRRNF
ncbi:hypothetical protein AAHC03_010121 [Spirometra sp. Aus1]